MAEAQPSLTLSDLRPGFQFHQYQLLEQIGIGGQGVVWSAEDRQRDDIVAIKFNEIMGSEQQKVDDELFERELGKLLKVQHANILPIYECSLEGQVRYLVSPFIAGGSILEKIKRGPLALEEALRFSTEIASALDFLHQQGIIHRDLKSSNVLLNLKNHTYLADFGLARSVSDTTMALHTGRGTPVFAPPEQHKLLAITAKSDIYSFGILLFEIFTGQLPWGGETILGIQQLYSNIELPDPCTLDHTLPPLMKDVLRRVTSADPALRPASAAEVMKMIYYIFEIKDFPLSGELNTDRAVISSQDAEVMLDQSLSRWAMADDNTDLGLTKFALIHLDQKKRNENKIQDRASRFMLFHALMYGNQVEYWWPKVVDPAERLLISSALLSRQNGVIAGRVLDWLVKHQNLGRLPEDLSAKVAASLLEMAVKSTDPALSLILLSGLQALIPPGSAWGDSILSSELNTLLGNLALEDSDVGDQAARLAGHLYSQPAVNFILTNADKDRLIPALLEIQHSAGRLPVFVPRNIRLQVSMEWFIHRLTIQPARLFGAYMLALVGTTIGIGAQNYLTTRTLNLLDTLLISTSLYRGLITGAVFSLGILLTRVIVERFGGASALLRIILATVAGATGLNIAMLIFHILFIKTAPSGFLITLGCTVIAFAYAIGGLVRFRWVSMLISISAIVLAISGTWWVHTILAAASNVSTLWTPLFNYEYSWPMSRIFFTSIFVALWIGIFGNLTRLTVEAEPNSI